MNYILPYLLGLLLPYVAKDQADIFQFSTKVVPLSFGELRQGNLNTTGGTDINCVLEHVLQSDGKVTRLLLLTDGATGTPTPELMQAIRDSNLRMNVVLPHNGNLHQAVEQLATSIVALPPLN